MDLLFRAWRQISGRAPVSYSGKEAAASWMDYALAGMFSLHDVAALDAAIACMPAVGAVVEVGSFAGRSTCFLLHLLKKHGRQHPLFTVDRWSFEGSESGVVDGSCVTHAQYREYVISQYRLNVTTWHADRLPFHACASSDDFFQAWQRNETLVDLHGRRVALGGPLAFALIDGDHSYEQTSRDLMNVDRHLVLGGLVFMHDTASRDGGPRKALLEAIAQRRYRRVLENPNALIRKTEP